MLGSAFQHANNQSSEQEIKKDSNQIQPIESEKKNNMLSPEIE